VSLRDVEGGVEIVVANPGTPIAPAHLSRLFDRFYRVDPSRQRKDESSSGIGLAIVKSIITAHAGKVAVESDRHSTRFIITLPTALT
jgi:two-component system heavy metal sensor histidine kinase CusS